MRKTILALATAGALGAFGPMGPNGARESTHVFWEHAACEARTRRNLVRSCSFCLAQLPILQELRVGILRRKVAKIRGEGSPHA